MRILLFFYTLLMIAGSVFTLSLAPRAFRDLGQERQRLKEELPGVEFEKMVEAGYRLNVLVLLVEIFYYYLLIRSAGPLWQLFYGGFAFGIFHIFYLVSGRLEKRRLSKGSVGTRFARFLLWLATLLTTTEVFFLVLACYLLLQPAVESA